MIVVDTNVIAALILPTGNLKNIVPDIQIQRLKAAQALKTMV